MRQDETKALDLGLQQRGVCVLREINFVAFAVVAHHTTAKSFLINQGLCRRRMEMKMRMRKRKPMKQI